MEAPSFARRASLPSINSQGIGHSHHKKLSHCRSVAPSLYYRSHGKTALLRYCSKL